MTSSWPAGPSSKTMHSEPWKEYAKWSVKLATPIVTVHKFGCTIVAVNTIQAATELLEKRSHFACRPRWPMAELLGRQNNVGFQYYGDRLRRSRKVLHAALNPGTVSHRWLALLDEHAMQLIRQFQASPHTCYTDIHSVTEELVVRFAYGRPPQSEYIERARLVMEETSEALQPGKWLVNVIPALMYVPVWFPGAHFQRWAARARQTFVDVTRLPFLEVKRDVHADSASPSFVQFSLANSSHSPEEDDIIMSAAGSLYSAGTDTLVATIRSFILLMLHHPDVQRRAYEELLNVVGTTRLPGMQDRTALPYIEGIIQEVHRFSPPVPLSPHSNWKEDEYLGYRIPRKTWVLANIWAMTRDESEYPSPERFRPDRYMSSDPAHATPRDPRTLVFGFGRRVCPGAHFADVFLYLVIARTLACFEVCADSGGEGRTPPSLDNSKIGLVV
ncbi:cytochrome P450 [Trametes elegans]|nr:cytochrome P450 [Trametes elegans]